MHCGMVCHNKKVGLVLNKWGPMTRVDQILFMPQQGVKAQSLKLDGTHLLVVGSMQIQTLGLVPVTDFGLGQQ